MVLARKSPSEKHKVTRFAREFELGGIRGSFPWTYRTIPVARWSSVDIRIMNNEVRVRRTKLIILMPGGQRVATDPRLYSVEQVKACYEGQHKKGGGGPTVD